MLTTLRGSVPTRSATVAPPRGPSRSALGAWVWERFGFVDTRGRRQPEGASRTGSGRPDYAARSAARASPLPAPAAAGGPSEGRLIQDLEIVRGSRAPDRAVWNTLMDREPPQGTSTFAGAQLRYLIRSAPGYLGRGLFGGGPVSCAPGRGEAWNHEQRGRRLPRGGNRSRFLTRPGLRCQNLASRGRGRRAADFRARYDHTPCVGETLVGPAQEGTGFKAVGFRYWGLTPGRGRPVPNGAGAVSRKKVFVAGGLAQGEFRPRLEGGVGRGRAGVGGGPAGSPTAPRPSGQERRPGGQNEGAARSAAPRADAYAGQGLVRAGRPGPPVPYAGCVRGAGDHRSPPDRSRGSRGASACDAGPERGGLAAGRLAVGVQEEAKRSPAPGLDLRTA